MSENTALAALLANLINGNLTDAKRQARRHSGNTIRDYFTSEGGMSNEKAALAALYLKDPSREAFQAYCDAV